MKRLHCPNCGHEVFFDSLHCIRCHTGLAIELRGRGALAVTDAGRGVACGRRATWACNWLAAQTATGTAGDQVCVSCELVDAGAWADDPRMVACQMAQRRALYQLEELGVAWRDPSGAAPLTFAYRSKAAGDEVMIGHRGGKIMLDIDEADPAHGEQVRSTLGEHYRTPLGHLRHELGHYVWPILVTPFPARLAEFRQLFGDETADYSAALERHYARLDDRSWRDRYVSFYASSHPWEDFAESWAQVMHVHDVVETAASWGIVYSPADPGDARSWLSTAGAAGIAANELARAMGMRDLYPFTLSAGARTKVQFCWRLLP